MSKIKDIEWFPVGTTEEAQEALQKMWATAGVSGVRLVTQRDPAGDAVAFIIRTEDDPDHLPIPDLKLGMAQGGADDDQVSIIVHCDDLDMMFAQAAVDRTTSEWCSVPLDPEFFDSYPVEVGSLRAVECHFDSGTMSAQAQRCIMVPHIVVVSQAGAIDTIAAYMPGSKEFPVLERCMCDSERRPLATLDWTDRFTTSAETQDVYDVTSVGRVIDLVLTHWSDRDRENRMTVLVDLLLEDLLTTADRNTLVELARQPARENFETLSLESLESQVREVQRNNSKKVSK